MPAFESDRRPAAGQARGGGRGAGRRLAPLACSLALVAGSGAACRSSASPERLVVGIVPLPGTVLVLGAQDQGTFSSEGLAIEFRRFDAGRDALRALSAHEVDVATAYETPVVMAAFGAAPPRILTRLDRARRGTGVVARADHGVAQVEDLRGKRVAVTRDTTAEFVLDLLLTVSGVRLDAITRVDRDPPSCVSALLEGEVDAAALWSPLGERAVRLLGPNARVLATDIYEEAALLVTRDDVLASRADALRRMLRALWRAEEMIAADRSIGEAVLARALPGEDAADLRTAFERITPQLGLDNLLLSVLTAQGEWLARRTGQRAPEVTHLLSSGLLEEVAPETVTAEVSR